MGCSDMGMRVILIAMLMLLMVSEKTACMPLKLKFVFKGDEVENNIDIKMRNGGFQSLPKGPVPPSDPSNGGNHRSHPSVGG